MKLKITDLRIGNIIKHSLTQCVVDSIYNHGDIDVNNEYEEWTASISECNPIPLTDEWLIDFGFNHVKIDRDKSMELICKNIKFFFYKNKLSFGIQGISNYEINLLEYSYVHQLQNLYFSLTGEELTYEKSNAY